MGGDGKSMIHPALPLIQHKKSYIPSEKHHIRPAPLMNRVEKRMVHPASPMNQHKKYHITLEKYYIRPAPLMIRAGKCMVGNKGNKKGRRLLLSPLLSTDLP